MRSNSVHLYIVTATTKISKTIGMLRHFVPCSVLVNIYNALITPYLTCGLISRGKA